MLRLRLFLMWLLVAALPLQGWAAATMLYCGPAQKAAVHAKAHATSAPANHHDIQAAHHGAQDAQLHHHTGDAASGGDVAQPASDAAHTCGVCAACCHAVAIAQTPYWPAITAAPAPDIAEPLVAVLAQPSPVPDKPPRA